MARTIKKITILTHSETNVTTDRRSLKRLRLPQPDVLGSGAEVMEEMPTDPAHVLLVDDEMDDMSGLDFLRMLRRSPEGRLLPVVMVTQENRREQVLNAISAGCSGYVLRPYALATFERHLQMAVDSAALDEEGEAKLARAHELLSLGKFSEAAEEFRSIVDGEEESHRYFDVGMRHLQAQRYGTAMVAFNRAVALGELFAEAHKGLAHAYRGLNDTARYLEELRTAAEIYALQDRLQETKEIFVEILKADPDAVNPYNALGVELRRKGDYAGAIHAYSQALELTPDDEYLFYNIAKAYLYAGDTGQAEAFLERALRRNPGFRDARGLYSQVAGKEWDVAPPEADAEPSRPAGSLPDTDDSAPPSTLSVDG
ncbi:response regulator receiver protein [Desulfovibrio sp. X2]|uniref:tetratricopeptide repeat protein n=1 Tax=Desulfovibrio sp. X2 TaxID=941449 RepID=UPI00035898B5|nr:tetratricopeptide repeat protein [Desulfovibrio sp. X2]EPR44677.1 response regulator receiver protein [Desulfovibrio sp. X2]